MTARAWVLLRSGRRLDLLNPDPQARTDQDIATGLARTYRWSGFSKWPLPLSVAQHSLTVLRLYEASSDRPPTAAERLRELAHDMEVGFLGYDVITPLKPLLGEGYARLVARLQAAIRTHYGLPKWIEQDHAAHKRADRLAAASEACHVVGWPESEVRDSLGIALAPVADDPLAPTAGMAPWEPWPPNVAAVRFLDELTALQGEASDPAGRPDEQGGRNEQSDATRTPPPTYVRVEGGCEEIEGRIVKGVRDADGAWNLDGVFTIETYGGQRFEVHGWNCITEVR